METVKLTYLRARIVAGFNMDEAAGQLEVPVGKLAAYERGADEPDAVTLVRMARLYRVSVDELIGLGRTLH